MSALKDIIEKVRSYQQGVDTLLLDRAYEYLEHACHGITRHPGASCISHAMTVADLAATLRLDCASVAAAMLHEVRRDAPDLGPDIAARFGPEVASLVDGLARLARYRFTSGREEQAEYFKKMLVAMSKDIRVLLIMLCDRLAEMRAMEGVSEQVRREVSEESLQIYSPLAERLGISWIRTELEDLAFRYLWPEEYAALKARADARLAERADFIQEVVSTIRSTLENAGLKGFEVFGRQKNLYGIYRKMRQQGIGIDHVYDFVAFRVIVREVVDCWVVLGLIHSRWTPIPARFKDFINVPKSNGYRSLHTTVFGPRQEPMEVQIRTFEMHKVAESGIAAHWTYKEGGGIQVRDQERFNWLKQLIEWAQEVRNPHQFLQTVQGSLFVDEVFCFTPKGELRVLPKGATPVDFAYEIHTDVGHRCTGARVNGRLVPLSTELKSGDLVEILTGKFSRPRRDWLTFVATARARNKIRQFFQAEERAHAVEIGKQLLERELRRHGIPHRNVIEGGEEQQRVLAALKLGSSEELFREIGLERLAPSEVAEVLAPGRQVRPESEREPARLREFFQKRPQGIAVDGVEDMLLRLGKCCNPIPGDPIVAFVTRGRGVTVHSRSCEAVRDADPERLLDAHWVRGTEGLFDVPVQLLCEDEPGLLGRVTKEVGDSQVNIASMFARPMSDGRQQVQMVLQVEDQGRLETVLRALRLIRGVVKVERLRQAPKPVSFS